MEAALVLSERIEFGDGVFAELVVWHVPSPVAGSNHRYKYRLALIAGEVCVLRYDNETGKGDHKHIGNEQVAYVFAGVQRLRIDFSQDVRSWLDENLKD
jgi:Family of unknown function (DUF6516)